MRFPEPSTRASAAGECAFLLAGLPLRPDQSKFTCVLVLGGDGDGDGDGDGKSYPVNVTAAILPLTVVDTDSG